MANNRVSIVFITDENYAMPANVAIVSAIKNKKPDSFYDIYVLGNSLSEKTLNNFENIKADNVTINVIEQDKDLNFQAGENTYVSQSACLKFYLPEIFKDLDKILYIDVDTIIQKDLCGLYNTNIEDVYAAVVTDFFVTAYKRHFKELNYKYNKYFNSGVMLLNLKKMREDNITEKLVDYKTNSLNFYMDQDAFNMVLNPKVKYLSVKYNFLISLFLQNSNFSLINSVYNENVKILFKRNFKDVSIIHYANIYKPWLYSIPKVSKLFLEYYKLSVYKNDKLKLKPYKFSSTNKISEKIKRIFKILRFNFI